MTKQAALWSTAALWVFSGAVLVLPACDRCSPTPPRSTQVRAPDVPYDPSPYHVVEEMLRLANVGRADVVFDLGCGDGRIVIAAVAKYGARGVCIDIDPQRIRESRENARKAGVADRIEFRTEDLFDANLRGATVVTLFLWPDINLRLRPKLRRELEPGARVVSYYHDMGDWKPDLIVQVDVTGQKQSIYLWHVR